MTEHVRVCSRDDYLNHAAQIMWDVDCGAVPVVDADQRLCGIITDRDICMAGYTKGIPLWSIRVGDVMTHSVHSCKAAESVMQAVSSMSQHQIRRLPVTDAQGHPIGMVALADLVRSASLYGVQFAQSLSFQLLRAICNPRRPTATGPHGHRAAAE
jgi:CBS-domain-containing membrane protein